MDEQTRPEPISGGSTAILAVTAMALIFLANGEMGFVPVLQVTAYRWALYALVVVMVAIWVELLVPRFRGPRREDGRLGPAGLAFAPAVSDSGRRWAWRLWLGGLALAAVTALLLMICAGLNRRGVTVPLDAVELGLALLAWPAACVLVLSVFVRRRWIRL